MSNLKLLKKTLWIRLIKETKSLPPEKGKTLFRKKRRTILVLTLKELPILENFTKF